MLKQTLFTAAIVSASASFADVAPIIGTWHCLTELENRGNAFVIDRRETYTAGGEHLSVARSYSYPVGEPDQLLMDVEVTTKGEWALTEQALTTAINEVTVVDGLNPNSEESAGLAQFLRSRGEQSVNISVSANTLIFSDPASGQTLECKRAGSQ